MILPSAYCGNIEYFHRLLKSEKVVIDLYEPYQKQTFRSRCQVAGANGIQTLSVPVERPQGKSTLVKDVQISYREDWRKDHLKAIESAYSRTPYFVYYFESIHTIIQNDNTLLWELNAALTSYLIDKLDLTAELSYSQNQIPLTANDFRVAFNSASERNFTTHRYIQTFEERSGFLNNLSVLDLLFNEGPNSISILAESGYSSL